ALSRTEGKNAVRTIAIINQKGGCGKTTTSINLAAVLALKGHRTLLVDMDPQSHCALGLAVPESQIERSTADLLQHGLDGTMSVQDVTWQISRGLDLAPSSMSLAMMEQQLAVAPDKDRRLVQVLSTVQDKYDYCIIDCPPSIGLLTFNALRAADEVLIPVETGYFAMQGSVRQEKTIDLLVRRVGHRVRFRVLPTMYDVRTKLAREILAELKKHFGERVLPLVINFNSKLKEAASFGQPITEYDAASRGMQDFDELATWLVNHPPAAAVPLAAEAGDAAGPGPAPAVDRARQAGGAQPMPVNEWPSRREAPVAAAPGPRAETPVTPAASSHGNPALSRAAELVERARALSAKTADLAERFKDDPDHAAVRPPTAPPMAARPPAPAAVLADHLTQTAPPPPEMAASSSAPADRGTPNGGRKLVPAAASPVVKDAPTAETLEEKLAKLYGVRHTSRGVLFVQPAANAADDNAPDTIGDDGNLAIAGDFNNWNPSQTPMTRDENLGVWRACVNVPPGRYRYRLVRNGQWVQDPFNRTVESNPFGELNNIIEIKG
ncbi:MAG: AAA family ATPase, partial [Planctomycetota bacterium]